ncbi:MAG: hypothetical protein LAO78_07380 [Acidobacteriia bacterium]|nr:hypothetical protein [Terriglobia bacterium]
MTVKRFLYLLGLISVLLLTSADCLACMCFGASDAKTMRDAAAFYSEGKNASKVIFEGLVEKQELVTGSIGAPSTAMSMTTAGEHRAAFVRVLRSYRGQASGTVMVMTGLSGGDCGFDFETGKQYLIYASEVGPGMFFTSICTGTSSMEEAGPALRLLRGDAPTADDLLAPQSYYAKVQPQFTATACGKVTWDDGTPAGKISVDMTQVRDEPFPPKTASDPDLSKPDGTFCISGISPGRYVLTADTVDFDHGLRWMGYYPGVTQRADAKIFEIATGVTLRDLNFSVHKQRVYTVSFRIVATDGSRLPLDDLGVMIDSHDRDALAYHLAQHLGDDGKYTVGYVPPGKYVIRTIPWGMPSKQAQTKIAKWRMANQEVEITSNAEIVLKLEPAK